MIKIIVITIAVWNSQQSFLRLVHYVHGLTSTTVSHISHYYLPIRISIQNKLNVMLNQILGIQYKIHSFDKGILWSIESCINLLLYISSYTSLSF